MKLGLKGGGGFQLIQILSLLGKYALSTLYLDAVVVEFKTFFIYIHIGAVHTVCRKGLGLCNDICNRVCLL